MNNVDLLHKELLIKMKSTPVKDSGYKDLQTYLGDTETKQLGLKNPDLDKVTNEFYKANKDLSYEDLISLLDKLYRGDYVEEKVLASFILLKYKEHKRKLELKKLEEWLEF